MHFHIQEHRTEKCMTWISQKYCGESAFWNIFCIVLPEGICCLINPCLHSKANRNEQRNKQEFWDSSPHFWNRLLSCSFLQVTQLSLLLPLKQPPLLGFSKHRPSPLLSWNKEAFTLLTRDQRTGSPDFQQRLNTDSLGLNPSEAEANAKALPRVSGL